MFTQRNNGISQNHLPYIPLNYFCFYIHIHKQKLFYQTFIPIHYLQSYTIYNLIGIINYNQHINFQHILSMLQHMNSLLNHYYTIKIKRIHSINTYLHIVQCTSHKKFSFSICTTLRTQIHIIKASCTQHMLKCAKNHPRKYKLLYKQDCKQFICIKV